MKALIQRVRHARVEVMSHSVADIGAGMLVFIGIDAHDTDQTVDNLSDRLVRYRLFADTQGRMNLDVAQTAGDILLVPQFTLSAQTDKGLRPGFSTAALPADAERLFKRAMARIRAKHPSTCCGQFGADMQVSLQNDGPVTFLLEN
ncbi:D-aminoacyl-tRNA deacylase [Reinekea sp.]|jgi:D-tyrosyl-tRNA(Tyr) deacylase|uniref:D-aminoacyl-tRNA deacylase n=1 Tax=Reinekea sp. TaxID=1970455 RepID=UPI002A8061A1|nr:D-aminoacyl-tRNA deacylase [Reinekea sp.]